MQIRRGTTGKGREGEETNRTMIENTNSKVSSGKQQVREESTQSGEEDLCR